VQKASRCCEVIKSYASKVVVEYLEVVLEVDLEDDDTLEVDVDDLEDCLRLEADVLRLLRLEIVDNVGLLEDV
jgi:hypothetical protein